MSSVLRLVLVSHGMTEAIAAGRFPDDEPLNGIGRRQVHAARKVFDVRDPLRELTAPEQRTRQTAALLGLASASSEPRLADLNCHVWRGRTLTGLDAEDLRTWLTDPAAAVHGGESIAELITRVSGWLTSLTDSTQSAVAVTHPAVIRAALIATLDIRPEVFWRIDISPASRTVLHFRDQHWTLRL